MISFQIVGDHQTAFDVFFTLENQSSVLVFALEKHSILTYYGAHQDTPYTSVLALAHLFSFEVVRYLSSHIPGGLFRVLRVHCQPYAPAAGQHQTHVAFHPGTADRENEQYFASFYGTPLVVESVNRYILNSSVGSGIQKVTGYPALSAQMMILEEPYTLTLCDHVRMVSERLFILKCSYIIEGQLVDFYFDESMVRHFCTLVLKNTSLKRLLPFQLPQGKIFAELFLGFMTSCLPCFIETNSVELTHIKDKRLLEFTLVSDNKQFAFFSEQKNVPFLVKLMYELPCEENTAGQKLSLEGQEVPFRAEVGVTYLTGKEYKNLTEGDILVFDKTCLSSERREIDTCVINLNGVGLVSSVQNGQCVVKHFTKDW